MSSWIECRALSRDYGAHAALREVSFGLERGQVVGLLGPNGAGKSTLLRILSGAVFQSAGDLLWQGVPNWDWPVAWRRRVGFLPEQNPLVPELTVQAHLEFCGAAHGLPRKVLAERLERVVADCHLESVRYRPAGELSRGFRQRTGLACALLHDPELLLLDEPTTGLDPNEILSWLALIRKLGHHKTVIHSTHILSEAEATCDRVWILRAGCLVADAVPSLLIRQADGHGVVLETDARDLAADLAELAGVRALECAPMAQGMRYTIWLTDFDENASMRVGDFCRLRGASVHGLKSFGPGLDAVFARLTRTEDS
jgi:ABC-2 type transport system ATP-binding protein